ncbi:MAG: coenzyme F420-0:L-glutamate ligase, partial [Puniceicoccales bacterium]|nr:coenzyme F420-0:L-glutamate ligase [Puniceicoccales bacterium]
MDLKFSAVRTRVLTPPRDDIFSLFDGEALQIADGDILCIASKCLAIHQGRCVRIGTVPKEELVKAEADVLLRVNSGLTVKDLVIIADAGIDESNGNGYYVLWPRGVWELLRQIHGFLCDKFAVKNLGLISVDSKLEPMRSGTIGVSQGIFGFNPVRDCRGNSDIFGRKLRVTAMNVADAIAVTACYLMGEGNECRPLVVASGVENIEFGCEFS